MGECLKCRGKLRGTGCPGGQAGPGGMGGRAEAPPKAPTPSPTGGIAPIEPRTPTTRRKTAPNAAKPPPARAAGTTRTRGHDKNRPARPRCLGAAATTAATPAESSRAQPWLRRAFRGPSLRCPDAPSHGPTTRLVERVPPPGRHPLTGTAPGRQHIRIGNQHPDRKPTSGYLNNLSTSA